jgi:malate dehydrogenase (quinone)
MDKHYDVIIVGAGIVGSALLYSLSRYSNLKNIMLVEKYEEGARLNSNSRNNGQTLHFGDIETTYTLEKAKATKKASEMLLRYARTLSEKERERIMQKTPQMVLAVGDNEIEFLKQRFDDRFKEVFPRIKELNKRDLSSLEPNIVKGRNKGEELSAIYSRDGYNIDFGELSRSFIKNALSEKGTRIQLSFREKALRVAEQNEGYRLTTNRGTYLADFIVFASGVYSLYFAKAMGYGKNLSIIAVMGTFYQSRKVTGSKIYVVQEGKIPFLGTHCDPDVNNKNKSRFGPTITLYPFLEKSKPSTLKEYVKSVGFDTEYVKSISNILSNNELRSAFVRNLSYTLPIFGKPAFVKHEVKKIIPLLEDKDIEYDKSSGGIRPQIIDKSKRNISVGDAKLSAEGIIFNITPSPGASSCLRIALEDSLEIANYLGKQFDKDRFHRDFTS